MDMEAFDGYFGEDEDEEDPATIITTNNVKIRLRMLKYN